MSTEILSSAESAQLADCEMRIERGLDTFVEVGRALLIIRDEALYRANFQTFESYCQERWGIERAHAYRAIDNARVSAILSPIGDKDHPAVANEAQARELAPLVEQPEKLREVWIEAVERSNGKPTAAIVREVREEVAPPSRSLADALDERTPGWRGDVADSRLRARWSRAIAPVAEIPLMDPTQVAAVLSDGEIAAAKLAIRGCVRFLDQLDEARKPGLRVVSGGPGD